MRIHDVSVPMHRDMVVWPGDPNFRRELTSSIADGQRANISLMSCSTHSGTHVDAPFHFIQNGATLDMIPLDHLIGMCRVIEVICQGDITREHLEEALNSGALTEDDTRVLFKTRNSGEGLMQSSEFHRDYCAIAVDAAEWLVERNFKTVGVDYLSVESFHPEVPQTHPILLGAGVFVIEGLNLYDVPVGEYLLSCGVWNIIGADGAPARVFLISDL